MDSSTSDRPTLFSLSDLHVLGPPQVNPFAAEAERLAEEECFRLGIRLEQFGDYMTMSAYLYPRASVERLVATTLMTNLLFYFDDLYSSDRTGKEPAVRDGTVGIVETFIDILHRGRAALPVRSLPIYAACLAVRDRLRDLSSDGFMRRLARSLEEHLRGAVLPLEASMSGGVLSLDKYIAVRELDAGMQPTLDLVEFNSAILLPADVRSHPTLECLRQCTIHFAGLSNDLFSYEKEVMRRGQRFNLVAVLMESRGLEFDQAVHQSVVILNGYAATFLRNEQRLPDWKNRELNGAVLAYVQGLRDILIATWHWQTSTNRYRSRESPFPELRDLLK